jgi:hypothetical protein
MVRSATDHFTPASTETVEAVEQRVRRLEDAVAALQDTQLMEDRVVERIVQRVDHVTLPRHESRGLIVEAGRMLPAKTIEASPADGLASADSPSGVEAVAVAARSTWLLMEVFRDFRAIVRMFTDYRYRMTWTARIVLVVAISVAVLSWFLLSGNFLGVGTAIDRVVLVVVVVVIYKVLSREVERYRELLSRIYRYR